MTRPLSCVGRFKPVSWHHLSSFTCACAGRTPIMSKQHETAATVVISATGMESVPAVLASIPAEVNFSRAAGIHGSTRQRLKCLIEQLQEVSSEDVAYCGDFTRGRTTHLVVAKPDGVSSSSKLAAARSWKVPVLQLEWLEQSLQAGRLLPEEAFLVCEAVSQTVKAKSSPAPAGVPEQAHRSKAAASESSALSRTCSSRGSAEQMQAPGRRPLSRLRMASDSAVPHQVRSCLPAYPGGANSA